MLGKEIINIRYFAIWLVIWGNVMWLLELPKALSKVNNNFIYDPRVIFLAAILSLFISRWLIPKIEIRRSFVSTSFINKK